jgi:predicted metal-dependent hydrolase
MFVQLNFDGAFKENGFFLEVNAARIAVSFRESRRARNYTIYVRRDGSVSVTIPRRGSFRGAQRFVESRRHWIARTLQRMEQQPARPVLWPPGTEVLCRGRRVPITIQAQDSQVAVYLESEFCGWSKDGENLRPTVEQWLQNLAFSELPRRVRELAIRHQSPLRRVSIRNQRSRWGSCSRHGTISLNWRLVQLPDEVRDYIILHELMHLREMNHSRRFWAEVESVCPAYETHEHWLKTHGPSLGL